jgi:hypothetical protein
VPKNPIDQDGCVCSLYKRCGGAPAVCAEVVAQTALALADMLKRLEYCAKDTPNGIIHEVCPICEYQEHEGHAEDCALGRLLKGLEG